MINLKTVISLERALDDEINPTCNVGYSGIASLSSIRKRKCPHKILFSKGGRALLYCRPGRLP